MNSIVFRFIIVSSGVFDGIYILLDYFLDGILAAGIFFVALGVIEVGVAVSQGTRDLPSMKNAIFAIAAGFIFIGLRVILGSMGVSW